MRVASRCKCLPCDPAAVMSRSISAAVRYSRSLPHSRLDRLPGGFGHTVRNSSVGVAAPARSTIETTAPTFYLPLFALRLFCEQLRQADINVTEIAFLFTREPCR